MQSLGFKLVHNQKSISVVEVLTNGGYPFRRVVEEFDSSSNYDGALESARSKLNEVQQKGVTS